MNTEKENSNESENLELNIIDNGYCTFKFTLPLTMIWQPKEDITAYELAMCLPYFFRQHNLMPYEVDLSLPHFRHFIITDPNNKNSK